MKKIMLSIMLVMLLSSCAFAELPSVTMLSTKTCPACTQMLKVFAELEAKYPGKISTLHIYLEDEPDYIKQYNIRFVPVLVFKDAEGKEIAQEIGYRSAENVAKIFENAGVNI